MRYCKEKGVRNRTLSYIKPEKVPIFSGAHIKKSLSSVMCHRWLPSGKLIKLKTGGEGTSNPKNTYRIITEFLQQRFKNIHLFYG